MSRYLCLLGLSTDNVCDVCCQDLPFEDGTTPSTEIIQRWCQLVRARKTTDPNSCIVVHCLAGLGRLVSLHC